MKKTLQTVAFLMATLSMLTACLPEGQPEDSAATTTTAAPEEEASSKPYYLDPAGMKQMILSAENIVLEYTLYVSATKQTKEVTLKRAGGKIEIVEKTSRPEGNMTYHTKATTYYDLSNNDIYRHDKEGYFYVYKLEEPFNWETFLSSEGFLLSEFGPVFNNDTYVWIADGNYVAPEDVLKKQSERKGKTFKSMKIVARSDKASLSCSMEGRSAGINVTIRKTTINFPKAHRLT